MSHQLSREEIGRLYIALMEEVKFRHQALADTLTSIAEEGVEARQTLQAEFAYLQVRRICELLALGVVAAHNRLPAARGRSFVHEYNASNVFKRLAGLNPLGFPRPFTGHRTADGGVKFIPVAQPIFDRQQLSNIYNKCGDMLHVGKLAVLLTGSRKAYDIAELRQWSAGLAELLSQHLIYLPGFEEVLIVTLEPDTGGGVQVAFGNMKPDVVAGQLTGTATIYHVSDE